MSKKKKNSDPKKISPYSEDIEQYIKNTYNQFPEKDRRLYAADHSKKSRLHNARKKNKRIACRKTQSGEHLLKNMEN